MSSINTKRQWPSQPPYWTSHFSLRTSGKATLELLRDTDPSISDPYSTNPNTLIRFLHINSMPLPASASDELKQFIFADQEGETKRVEQELTLLDPMSLERADGRFPEQPRPLLMQVGTISHAPGSVIYEAGKTRVLATIYGPRPIRDLFSPHGILNVEVEMSPGARQKNAGIARIVPSYGSSGVSDDSPERQSIEQELKSLSRDVHRALLPSLCTEMFSNTQLDLFITILEDDGSLLAHCVNAASMAALHAAVPMKGVAVAATGLILSSSSNSSEPTMLVDPNYREQSLATHHSATFLTIATLVDAPQTITLCQVNSTISTNSFVDVPSLRYWMLSLNEQAIRPTEDRLKQVIADQFDFKNE